MRSYRSIKHWLVQLILLAGLLTYTDSVAVSVLPTMEVSSWIHTPDVTSEHKLAHFNSIQWILDGTPIGFNIFQFNTYLSSVNGKKHTAELKQRDTFILCKTLHLQFIAQRSPRLDLPRITA